MDPQEPQFTPKALSAPEELPRLPVGQQLFLLASIMLLLLGGAIGPRVAALTTDSEEPPQNLATASIAPEVKDQSNDINPFSEVSISAEAVFVWDVREQRVLYSENPDRQLPLASITKLMTALVATELLEETEPVAIDDEALRQDGISSLSTGETFSRLDLSDLTLITSSNDGAYALATAAGEKISSSDTANTFVKAMNIRADELGLTNTYFKNPTGLDINTSEGGAYGSVRDVTFLMEYILKNEPGILEPTTRPSDTFISEQGFSHTVNNTNYYLSAIPGLIGSKTGYTALAGGNLVIAFNAGLNRPIIISVLGSTRHDRFTDVINLAEETQTLLSNQ